MLSYQVGLEVVPLCFQAEPSPSAIAVLWEKNNDLLTCVGTAELL